MNSFASLKSFSYPCPSVVKRFFHCLYAAEGGTPNHRFALAKPVLLFHRLAMHSYELLREVFDKKAPKQVAADLGLSLSMVYKWAEPPDHAAGSGTSNPLDRIEALLTSTGDHRLVQWICQRAGGFFILNPKNTPHPHFLIPIIFHDYLYLLNDSIH